MADSGCQQVLRVNLTTGKFQKEILPHEEVRSFIGARALGAKILYDEVTPGIHPLGVDNKLIFSTGPLCGTNAPGSARYCVHTKSPQTGLYLVGTAGGYFGPELKKTGHAAVIIEGKAEEPVYLVISNTSVEIKDASRIWGMDTNHAQQFIKDELGNNDYRVACIGPAGERLVPFASIISERRAVGRGGVGAVMGSKNLKAIAVKGTERTKVANDDTFRLAVKQAIKELIGSKSTEQFAMWGSGHHMEISNQLGIIPFRNWQEVCSPKISSIAPDIMRERFLVKDVRCAPPCPVKCSKITLVKDGFHAGAITEGPDYEALYSLGACCDITDFASLIEADALCDLYGLDVISTGVCLAFAMECYEKGIISKEDTGGIELKFGRSDLLVKLIRDTAYRQDFGEIMSLGTKVMAERLGKGSEQFAMHCKGLELGGYDPRGAKSMALVYACGSRGGCHKTSGLTALADERLRKEERLSDKLKGPVVKRARDRKVIVDSAIMCQFVALGVSDSTLARLLSGAIGYDFSVDGLYIIGERGSNVERCFNVREGLRRSWDTLPYRLLKESPPFGPTKEQVVNLEPMLDDFYEVCGWDVKTGIPTVYKLNELGLQKVAQDLQ